MRKPVRHLLVLVLGMLILVLMSGRLRADIGSCGGASVTLPFSDVGASAFFCQIAETYFSGLTNGSSATTYSPGANVTRDQMAAFITRAQDSALRRGSRRAVLDQFSIPQVGAVVATSVGTFPELVKSDGADLWVANFTSFTSGTVSRVRASDGSLLGTWTGADAAFGVLVAMGKVFVTGETDPGSLYEIDPTMPPGAVTTIVPNILSNPLGHFPFGIAFDGTSIWTANQGNGTDKTGSPTGSVSKVTLHPPFPPDVTTVSNGFNQVRGILFDGSNIWVTAWGQQAEEARWFRKYSPVRDCGHRTVVPGLRRDEHLGAEL
jgi:hypothetical protein